MASPPTTSAHIRQVHRTDTSRNRDTGGSGIGLTIARALAEAHRRHIVRHQSRTRPGSRFTLTLPLSRSVPARRRADRLSAGRKHSVGREPARKSTDRVPTRVSGDGARRALRGRMTGGGRVLRLW